MRTTVGFLMASVLIVAGAAAAAAPPVPAASVASAAEGIAATLTDAWLVKIEGETRMRTLTVFRLAPTGFGTVRDTATLEGTYGYTGRTAYPVTITAGGRPDDVEIAFVSSGGARVHARSASPSELRGTFQYKGQTKTVVITRAPVAAVAARDSRITLIYVSAYN